jgi:hypothetical protein
MPSANVSDGVTHLSDSIVACGILPLLKGFGRRAWEDRPSTAALLACYACFAAEESAFGPVERAILREFQIGCIAESAWWARLVIASAEPEPAVGLIADLADLHTRLRLVADTLPNIISEPGIAAAEPGMAHLRVSLPGKESGAAHPLRLSTMIEAVCMLWTVVCGVMGVRASLSLAACVPKPEISVTFAGPAAPVAELKALLMQIWDLIIASHNASFEQRLETIPPQLAATYRTGAGGVIVAAQQQSLETGVRMFLEVGACLPEMDDPDRFSPARLLQVSPALQCAAASTDGPRPSRPPAGDRAIVADDLAQFPPAMPVPPIWIGKIRVG